MGPSNASGYFRGPGGAPHNLYTSTDNIWFQTPPDQPGPPPQQFQYVDVGAARSTAQPTAGVQARVGSENIEWTWNPATGKFERSQRGRPARRQAVRTHRGHATSSSWAWTTAAARSTATVPKRRRSGRVPCGCSRTVRSSKGRWKREIILFPIEYLDADGEPIALQPGNTWIELADNAEVNEGRIVVLPATAPAP